MSALEYNCVRNTPLAKVMDLPVGLLMQYLNSRSATTRRALLKLEAKGA